MDLKSKPELYFDKTCAACPEQYTVYDKYENIVGYVRLRYGILICEYPDVGGEEIYSAIIGDEWTGEFESNEQREYHLTIIADKIMKRINKTR